MEPAAAVLVNIGTIRNLDRIQSEAVRMSDAPAVGRIEAIDDNLAEILRNKTPLERVQMIGAANHTARLLAAAGARFNHPDWNEDQIQAEIIRRVCGGTS
jgi:hypothetical protein